MKERRAVVWKVYRSGRYGVEKELGYVVAAHDSLDWIAKHTLSYAAHVACDIVADYKATGKEATCTH